MVWKKLFGGWRGEDGHPGARLSATAGLIAGWMRWGRNGPRRT